MLFRSEQQTRVLVGPSDYGLADPIQNTAFSLMNTMNCLLCLDPNYESILHMHVIVSYFDEIKVKAVETQEQIEKTYKINKKTTC